MAQPYLPLIRDPGNSRIQVFQSASAAERRAAAREFVRSYKPGTELLLIGASREAVDDFASEICVETGASFGLHRFTMMQLVARLAAGELATAGQAPATYLGAEAIAARATFEALEQEAIHYFEPVARHPGFAAALASTLNELRLAGIDPNMANVSVRLGQMSLRCCACSTSNLTRPGSPTKRRYSRLPPAPRAAAGSFPGSLSRCFCWTWRSSRCVNGSS